MSEEYQFQIKGDLFSSDLYEEGTVFLKRLKQGTVLGEISRPQLDKDPETNFIRYSRIDESRAALRITSIKKNEAGEYFATATPIRCGKEMIVDQIKAGNPPKLVPRVWRFQNGERLLITLDLCI